MMETAWAALWEEESRVGLQVMADVAETGAVLCARERS